MIILVLILTNTCKYTYLEVISLYDPLYIHTYIYMIELTMSRASGLGQALFKSMTSSPKRAG